MTTNGFDVALGLACLAAAAVLGVVWIFVRANDRLENDLQDLRDHARFVEAMDAFLEDDGHTGWWE